MPCNDVNNCSWSKQQIFKNQRLHNGNLAGEIDISFVRLALEVDPHIRHISGDVTHVYKNLSENSEISFELANEMIVDSLWLNGNFVPSSGIIRIGNNSLKISNTNNNLNRTDTIRILYHGVPPNTDGFGSFAQVFRGNDSVPVMWTLSQPFGARDWWPCRQVLGDKIDSLIIELAVSKPFIGIANGMLINKKEEGNRTIFTYKHNYPIPAYLIAFAATNYSYYEEKMLSITGDSVLVENYLYPEDSVELRIQAGNFLEQQFEIFEQYFGPYPFSKERYGHAQFGWGGGMEHTTISFMNNLNFELMAHELAHAWFGNNLTCASWKDIWLNEGFATWLVGLCYEKLLDRNYWSVWKNITLERILANNRGSVYVDDTTSVSRIFNARLSYSKGSFVMHMLRWHLGDSILFSGVRKYIEDQKFAFGFAKTEDLKAALELESGLNLDWYFQQWVFDEGFPVINGNYLKLNEQEIVLRVNQKPSIAGNGKFKLKLLVRLYSKNQSDSLDYINNWLGEDTIMNLKANFDIDSVALDPDQWLIAKIGSVIETGINCISVFPNPVTDRVTVSFCNPLSSSVKVNVIDVAGKIVNSNSLRNGERAFSIDLSTYQNGVYIISIVDNKTVIQKKVIKIP